MTFHLQVTLIIENVHKDSLMKVLQDSEKKNNNCIGKSRLSLTKYIDAESPS